MENLEGGEGMNYFEETKDFRLINLPTQLRNPTLIRVDINSTVVEGVLNEKSLRCKIYSNVLEFLSEYTGLIVVAHQGRKGEKDFLPLNQHFALIRKHLPLDIDFSFIPKNEIFTEETKKKIKALKEKEIILLDNIRYFDWETSYNPENSLYINFFKGLVNTCINDAIPVWHRAHTSIMALPKISRTYVGVRSTTELKILHEIDSVRDEDKAIVMGGKKFGKTEYILNIAKKMQVFTGGIPGQLLVKAKGYNLGPQNEEFLLKEASKKQFELAGELLKMNVEHPVDFILYEKGEVKRVELNELSESNGLIVDIGEETVDRYSEKLASKEVRIRAGPLGVFEKGFINGIKLTKRILGYGLVFVGGDTTQELVNEGLLDKIQSTGGQVLLSGGAFLHRLAGFNYPSLDEIIKQRTSLEI